MKRMISWKRIGYAALALAVLIGVFVVSGSADSGFSTGERLDYLLLQEVNFYIDATDPEDRSTYFVVIGNKDAVYDPNGSNAVPNSAQWVGNYAIPERVKLTYQSTGNDWFNAHTTSNVSGEVLDAIRNSQTGIYVKKIAPCAFIGSSQLKGITFPRFLESIGAGAFQNTGIGSGDAGANQNYGSVTLPASLTEIGEHAFDNCGDLKGVIVVAETNQNSGLTIGDSAFANCSHDQYNDSNGIIHSPSHIVNVTIERPVTIGDYAFQNAKVETVSIPYATTIGDNAFEGAALTSFAIPATLESIGAHAFSGNNATGLTVALYEYTQAQPAPDAPAASLTIGAYAFSDINVTSVTLPNRTVNIGAHAFDNNEGMTTLNLGGTTTVGDYAFYICGPVTGGSVFTWSTQVASVGDYAFASCRLLNEVDLSGAASVGAHAFDGSSITSLVLPANEPGVSAFASCASLAHGAPGEGDTYAALTIPATWVSVPEGCFEGATHLGELEFEAPRSAGLTIGAYAFKGVGSGQGVEITTLAWPTYTSGEAVTPAITSIGREAFMNCRLLANADMTNVTYIGASAFESSSITGFTLPASQPAPANYTDENGVQLGFAAASRIFANCSNLTAAEFPNGWTRIPEGTFFGCSNLATANTGNVTAVDKHAFYGCEKLAALTMQKVETIGVEAFADAGKTASTFAYALTDGTDYALPHVTSVGAGAFVGSKIFNNDTYNANPTALQLTYCTVGEAAFAGSHFADVTLTDCNVGKAAFAGPQSGVDTQFGTLTIKSSVIGTDAGDPVFGAATYFFNESTHASVPFGAASFGDLTVSGEEASTIKKNAFQGASFTGMEISAGGSQIGEGAFNSVTISGDNAAITVSGNSVSIGKNAFQNAAFNAPTGIPVSVTGASVVIGQTAFAGTTITSLSVSGSNVNVGASAFQNVTVTDTENGVKFTGDNAIIGENAFNGATLTGNPVWVTGANSNIGAGAFSGTSFASLWLGGNITTVANGAFQNATIAGNVTASADNVTIGDTNATDANGAFNGAQIGGNLSFEGSSAAINPYAFNGAQIGGDLSFEGSSATIGANAFQTAQIGTAQIGGALTFSGDNATVGNAAFQSAQIVGDVAFTGASAAIGGAGATSETGAFAGATIGGNLSIKAGTIGQYAFAGATIGGGEYAGTVTIGAEGAGATTVGAHAFEGAKFQTLTANTSPVSIGYYAFAHSETQPSLGIHNDPSNPEDYATRDHTLQTVDISAATSINGYAFLDRAALTALTLPNEGFSTSNLGVYTFSGCSGLPSLTVPASWTSLPNGTFYGCESMTVLTLPSVKSVGEFVFTTIGTTGSHSKIYFLSSNENSPISIASNAFHRTEADGTRNYSYLEIHLEQCERFSVGGWRSGWGAYQKQNQHYWIYWKEVIGAPGSVKNDYYEPRITLTKSGNEYTVTASRLSTHLDIYTYLGYCTVNDSYEYPTSDIQWATDVPDNGPTLVYHVAYLDDENNLIEHDYDLPDYEHYDVVWSPVNDGSSKWYFYAITSIEKVVVPSGIIDNITSWDYRYGLFYGSNAPWTLPLKDSNDQYYYIGSTYTYDFDRYLRDNFPLGVGEGKYNVTAIGNADPGNGSVLGAFETATELGQSFTEIFVPDTVRTIGDRAFYGESFLTTLTGAANNGNGGDSEYDNPVLHLESAVGTSAFEGCTALTQISIDSGVSTEIGTRAFYGCTNLSALSLSNAGDIGESAFENCAKLNSLTFATVGNIGECAFKNAFTETDTNGANKTVTINGLLHTNDDGDPTINIGKWAFANASKLGTLAFGDNVTGVCTLGIHNRVVNENNAFDDFNEDTSDLRDRYYGAFYNCDALTSVSWGGLTSVDIGAYTFRDCGSLASINWPATNNIVYIGALSFYSCGSLTTVTIAKMGDYVYDEATGTGNGGTKATIGAWAFAKCSALHEFTVNSGYLASIRESAFSYSYRSGEANGTFTMNAAVEMLNGDFDSCWAFNSATKLKTIVFSEVGLVGSYAFAFNGGQINTIARDAFDYNPGLKHVTLPYVVTLADSMFEGYNDNRGKFTLLEDVTFSHVKSIGNRAFVNKNNLKEVDMPGVETIGASAFLNAGVARDTSGRVAFVWTGENGLNTTLKTINTSAFEGCKLLDAVTVPGGTGVSVSNSAFARSSATEVTFEMAPPEYCGNFWFENCLSLKKAVFPSGGNWTAIPKGTFKGCSKLGTATDANGDPVPAVVFGTVTSIGDEAFMNAGTYVPVDENDVSVAAIVDVPNTIQSIGTDAFANCKFLDDAILTGINADNGIGDRAFLSSSVNAVELPQNYNGPVGERAFESCQLETLTVPGGWTAIPASMFAGNAQMTELEIGSAEGLNAFITIDSYAFSGCTALRTVTIHGDASIGTQAFSDRTGVSGLPTLGASFATATVNGVEEYATITMDQVTTLYSRVFKGCVNLGTVNMASIKQIGSYAFAGCENLSRVNYAEDMSLMKHNKFRDESRDYIQNYEAEDPGYLYRYDPDGGDALVTYDPVNPPAGNSPDAEQNWVFSMCTLPCTTRSIGEEAFTGTPFTDLYIADIKLATGYEQNNTLANAPTAVFSENAFAGSSLKYIFVQHNMQPTGGAPWGAGNEADPCVVEWDNCIIGDPVTGLYYNYLTGVIVGVYRSDMTVMQDFPTNIWDGRKLKSQDAKGIAGGTIKYNSVRDIVLPLWIMDEMSGANFTVGADAFARSDGNLDSLLRLSVLDFYDEACAQQLARGFGLILPSNANLSSSVSEYLNSTLGDQATEVSKFFAELGRNDEINESTHWEDVLGYLLEHYGNTSLVNIEDPSLTWQGILDAILSQQTQHAQIEWLEQPKIEFGGNYDADTPRVEYTLEKQAGYITGNVSFLFTSEELSGTVPYDPASTAVRKANLFADELLLEQTTNSGTIFSGRVPFDKNVNNISLLENEIPVPAKVDRTETYYIGEAPNGRYTGYYKNDLVYKDATSNTLLPDDNGEYAIADLPAESHIFKLTVGDIGDADYYTVYDTIYCRVTYTRDNRIEDEDGAQNPDFSINYTTVYEFLDPAAFDALPEQQGTDLPEYVNLPYNEVMTLIKNEEFGVDETATIQAFFNYFTDPDSAYHTVPANQGSNSDIFVPCITFQGMFGEPKLLTYDLDAQEAVALANDTFGLTGTNAFTADDVSFADNMIPQVWMTSAFETRVQGLSPKCEKTVTVNGGSVTYKLVFAGWSTKQDDDSVYTQSSSGETQFAQPYGVVKPWNTVPQPITLHAVWKVSQTKQTYIRYGENVETVRLNLTDSTGTSFNDSRLQPKKYGFTFMGYDTDPDFPTVNGGTNYPLIEWDANGQNLVRSSHLDEVYPEYSDDHEQWTNVYSHYVYHIIGTGYRWLNVRMNSLLAHWEPVSDSEMISRLVLRAPDMADQTFYIRYNDEYLYTDENCTTPATSIATPNNPAFSGWYTAEQAGVLVIDSNGQLYSGINDPTPETCPNGWYGGADGWTIGNWNNCDWESARWVALGDRTLYAFFSRSH